MNQVFFAVYAAATGFCWFGFLTDIEENTVGCSPWFRNVSLTARSLAQADLRVGPPLVPSSLNYIMVCCSLGFFFLF